MEYMYETTRAQTFYSECGPGNTLYGRRRQFPAYTSIHLGPLAGWGNEEATLCTVVRDGTTWYAWVHEDDIQRIGWEEPLD